MESVDFDFDSETNIVSTKIPSAKSINKNFCGKKNAAGIWISHENMIAADWSKNCSNQCTKFCTKHFINTSVHIVSTTSGEEIFGCGIENPKICVLRRSQLIRLDSKGVYKGSWRKGDGEFKDEKGEKKYTCARRFLMLFIDENNKLLHKNPIQLTAKGVFQVEFDKNFTNFKTDIQNAYAKFMKRTPGTMKELWYAMCVFCPEFESKLVGQFKKSEACFTKIYKKPDENNWQTMCVGKSNVAKTIIELYKNSENWKNKYSEQQIIDDNVSSYSEELV